LLAFINNEEAALPKPRLIAVTNSRAGSLVHPAQQVHHRDFFRNESPPRDVIKA
jgi:hypothetical protein